MKGSAEVVALRQKAKADGFTMSIDVAIHLASANSKGFGNYEVIRDKALARKANLAANGIKNVPAQCKPAPVLPERPVWPVPVLHTKPDDAISESKAAATVFNYEHTKTMIIMDEQEHRLMPELYYGGMHSNAFKVGEVVLFMNRFHIIKSIRGIPQLFEYSINAGLMTAVIEVANAGGSKFVNIDNIKKVRRPRKFGRELLAGGNFNVPGEDHDLGDIF